MCGLVMAENGDSLYRFMVQSRGYQTRDFGANKVLQVSSNSERWPCYRWARARLVAALERGTCDRRGAERYCLSFEAAK